LEKSTMAPSYRFQIGSLACAVVSDGTHTYCDPAQLLFANVPQKRLDQALRKHGLYLENWNELVSPYPALLIRTDRHLVLVDTGAGSGTTTGQLIPNLKAERVALEEIDTVILTYAHPDHIGGNLDREGRPTFSAARYVLSRAEWDFWTSGPDLSTLQIGEPSRQHLIACAQHNLLPFRDQLDLVKGETEVVPGIPVLSALGHTPGHVAVAVHSAGAQLLYLSDVALHPVHLAQPGWHSAFDLVPEQALATRRRLLKRAAVGGTMVHAFRFLWPGLGHIVSKGDAWVWQPISAL
jgi:glyoxylase-like metal-dependent hydrolase (beta-lactamase superfamily II)